MTRIPRWLVIKDKNIPASWVWNWMMWHSVSWIFVFLLMVKFSLRPWSSNWCSVPLNFDFAIVYQVSWLVIYCLWIKMASRIKIRGGHRATATSLIKSIEEELKKNPMDNDMVEASCDELKTSWYMLGHHAKNHRLNFLKTHFPLCDVCQEFTARRVKDGVEYLSRISFLYCLEKILYC